MTRGRVGDKTFTGKMGVATDHLRAIDKLRKTPEGRFGRIAAPFQAELRTFIESAICPWCGNGPYKVLANHTTRAHAVSGADLREMAGLTKSVSICDPGYAAKMSAERMGHRLPDLAYARKSVHRRFSEAGLAVQRQKLVDANANDPDQWRRASQISATRKMAANAEKYAAIERLIGEGKLLRDIAATVGLHPRSVAHIARRLGMMEGDGRTRRGRVDPPLPPHLHSPRK